MANTSSDEQALLDDFIVESRDHLSSVEDKLLAIEQTKGSPDPDIVNEVFRGIHSIKGLAGFFGLQNIGRLSHVMETLLDRFRKGKLQPTSDQIDALLSGVDLLATMIDDVQNSDALEIDAVHDRIHGFLEPAKAAPTRSDAALPPAPPPASGEPGAPHASTGAGGDAAATATNAGADAADPFLRSIPKPPSEHGFVYRLRYDLARLLPSDGKTLVTLIQELSSLGTVLDACIQPGQEAPNHHEEGTAADEAGPMVLPLELLYSSVLQPDMLAETAGIREERLVYFRHEQGVLSSSTSTDAGEIPDTAGGGGDGGGGGAETSTDHGRTASEPTDEEAVAEAIQAGIATADDSAARALTPAGSASPPTSGPDPERGAMAVGPKRGDAKTSGPAAGSGGAGGGKSESPAKTIRVNVELMDRLMNLAGEMVLVRNQQLLAIDRADPRARAMVQRLDVVTSELQETVMQTRMQPIGNLFGKMPRVVRDLGKKLGKVIELHTEGDEVEMDKSIIESLSDAMTHLIRNSCDHGVERPADREAAGKPRAGNIWLRAFHEGGQINVEIRDDGRGIDPHVVMQKALRNRLKTQAELEKMTDSEIFGLIFLPGFSTAEAVTDVSGRGVGMDVVRSGIEGLGGSLEVNSTPGAGTCLRMRLPLTLAIIPCLMVEVEGQRFAIPQLNVEELVRLYGREVYDKIEFAYDRSVFRLRGQLLPLLHLADVLERPRPFDPETRVAIKEAHRARLMAETDAADFEARVGARRISFAVVRIGARRFGLVVDRILGTEEIVVKPMHPALSKLKCYSGATIMGDGTVAMILDLEGVAHHGAIGAGEEPGAREGAERRSDAELYRTLLFRAGPKETLAVALPLVSRLERIRADQIHAIGEAEYVTLNDQTTRVLRFETGLGTSATAIVEGQSLYLLVPKYIEKPAGFLLTEILDIRDLDLALEDAEGGREGLLGTATLDGAMVLFPDLQELLRRLHPEALPRRGAADGLRVLVAEDSLFFRHIAAGALRTEGYAVTAVTDGAEAMAALERADFDLLISDIEMPNMDGLDLVRGIRARSGSRHLPAIALSALGTEDARAGARAAGFDRFVPKGDHAALLAAVEDLLAVEAPLS